MKVIGIGEKKTLNPFITACDKFIYIEILKKEIPAATDNEPKSQSQTKKPAENKPLNNVDPEIIKLLSTSIADLADDNGWAFLGEVGTLMLKKKPDFDPRNYGFLKMLPFIKSMKDIEVDERESGKNLRYQAHLCKKKSLNRDYYCLNHYLIVLRFLSRIATASFSRKRYSVKPGRRDSLHDKNKFGLYGYFPYICIAKYEVDNGLFR